MGKVLMTVPSFGAIAITHFIIVAWLDGWPRHSGVHCVSKSGSYNGLDIEKNTHFTELTKSHIIFT